jgi:hypothetical protein
MFTLHIQTAEELVAEQAAALVAKASRLIQARLDATAQERGYFDALACVSYRGDEEEPVWAAEAEAFHRWRSRVWRICAQHSRRSLKDTPPRASMNSCRGNSRKRQAEAQTVATHRLPSGGSRTSCSRIRRRARWCRRPTRQSFSNG